jgi:hypothetical protein
MSSNEGLPVNGSANQRNVPEPEPGPDPGDNQELPPTKSPDENGTPNASILNPESDVDSCHERTTLLSLHEDMADIDYADESYPPSPVKYMSHPDDYLPVYQSNVDVEGSENGSRDWLPNGERQQMEEDVTTNNSRGLATNGFVDSDLVNDNLPAPSPFNDLRPPALDCQDLETDSDSGSLSEGRMSTFV